MSDLRPALYRHLLLLELDAGDLRVPESEIAHTFLAEAARKAEKVFHDAYKPGSRCNVNNSEVMDNSADIQTTEAIPKFELQSNAARRVIRNPLRVRDAVAGHPSGDSHHGSDSQNRNDGTDANEADVKHAGTRRYSSVYRDWIVDSGADTHSKCHDELSERDLSSAYEANEFQQVQTAGGPISVTHNISMQLQALGAAKPIECNVYPTSMNLMSVGCMVVDEGYSFYWTHGGLPHLVTPSGESIWLEVKNRTPVLTTQELVANKINEFNAYAMIDAATSRRERAMAT